MDLGEYKCDIHIERGYFVKQRKCWDSNNGGKRSPTK